MTPCDTCDDKVEGSDVALIKIDRNHYKHVNPRVRHWDGPKGVANGARANIGDPVLLYGQGLKPHVDPEGAVELRPGGARRGSLSYADSGRFVTADLIAQEGPGDSGSPYLHEPTGHALGLNGNCLCGAGVPGYPTLEYALKRFQDKHGLNLGLVQGGNL